MLREALRRMGARLIGNGPQHLVPGYQPAGTGRGRRQPTPRDAQRASRRSRVVPPAPAFGRARTQHTGLPPRGRGRR